MKRVILFLASALASGALLCLALPPSNLSWLGWIALVPLMTTVRQRGFLFGFIGGLLALFSTAFLVKSGIFYPSKSFAGEDGWIVTGCGLFGFVVSVLMAVWADRGSKKPIWWYAALAVSLESVLLLVLPAHLALTQSRQLLLLWIASIGGIWAVSFLVWWVNLLIADMVVKRSWSRLWIPAAIIALVGIAQPFLSSRDGGSTYVVFGLVQSDKTDEVSLAKLHRQASKDASTIVVWPEFAGLGIAYQGNTAGLSELVSKNGGAPLVTSFNDDLMPMPHNAAALVASSGSSPFYFKQKLFGGEKSMHTPGKSSLAVDSPQGKVALGICFDSCYPAIVREAANLPGVRSLALPTIDPESPHHFIAAIHAAFTPFRAAENGIVIARADGFAYSMIVDSRGKIVKELEPGEGTAYAKASTGGPTPYRRFGDWFLYLAYVLVGLGIIKSAFSKSPSKA